MAKAMRQTRNIPFLIAQLLIVVTFAGRCAPADINGSEIKIVVNPSVRISQISRDELERIFLITKTSLAGGDHVEPVLEKNGHANEVFLREYIGRTEAALMTYYRSLVFTGKASVPKSFSSDEAVIDYVARTKGAIGYVSANAGMGGVKALKVQ